jgi:hypothetical protein
MFPLFGWVGSQQISKNRILTNIVLGKVAGLTYLSSTTSWILLVVEWRLAAENLAEPGPSGPSGPNARAGRAHEFLQGADAFEVDVSSWG